MLVNTDLTAYKPKEIQETGGECVNCHMPQTVYMQRHWRHDHGFTIPDPLLTKQAGIPNACNRCHQDKDTDWALKYCDEWYGAKMDRPSRQRTRVIASARKGEPAASNGLLGLLATNEIPYWRGVAARILASWAGEARVRAALLVGLGDTNALVRTECAHALEPLAGAGVPAWSKRCAEALKILRAAFGWRRPGPCARASIFIPGQGPSCSTPSSLMPTSREARRSWAPLRWREAMGSRLRSITQKRLSGIPIPRGFGTTMRWCCRASVARRRRLNNCKPPARLEPRNAEFQYKLALGWNELGQTGKTIECLQTAVRIDPAHARAWYNLGLVLNSNGRTEEALEALTRAESADGSDPRSPYARATILARLGRPDEARRAAQRALEIEPRMPAAQELLRTLP